MREQSKNTSLKIGILLDDTLDVPDGVQQYIMTIGDYFRKKGHEVHYIVAETNRRDIPNVHSLAKFYSIKFNGNSVRTPLPVDKKSIEELTRELKLDVLHVQLPFSPFFAGKVIRAVDTSCRVVGTWHTFPSTKIHFASNVALSLLLRRTLKRFDTTIGVSKATAEFTDKAYGTKSIVIPNAVNLSVFSTHHEHSPGLVRTVLFLGRFVERKGPLHLINALYEVKKRGFDMNRLRIVMAGRGELLETAKSVSAKMGLHVEFPGFIKENEKAKLLASADVAVFPSTGGEAFGISVVEALATGTAVVLGGDNAGYRGILEQLPKQLFNPKNTQEFADTLMMYLSLHGAKRQNVIAKQLQIIKQYDMAVVGDALLDVYRGL